MERQAWEFMVTLRSHILSTMSGIENSQGYLWWDNTTPNSTTRRRLRGVLEEAIQYAQQFGIYVVTRHTDCGRRTHDRASDQHGYVWADRYGLNVEWLDRRYVWNGDQLFQGARNEPCPCSKADEAVEHHVIDDFIFSPNTSLELYRTISGALSDIQEAIEEAGDKKPRSGIREHLLRAVLQLNDAIMPTTVEAHIAAVMTRKSVDQ